MRVDVRADTLQVGETFLAQGECILAWGQSLKVLDHGSLMGSGNHQAASSILLPLTGASGQVAQGRDRVLVAVLQLPQCRVIPKQHPGGRLPRVSLPLPRVL